MKPNPKPTADLSFTPMDRREFLRKTSLAAIAFSVPLPPLFLKEQRMGIVVHSYGSRWNSKVASKKYPGFSNAMELLDHSHSLGAGGIQVGIRDWTKDFSAKIRDKKEKLGLYIEGSVAMPKNEADLSRFEQEILVAKEGGVQINRTVCSAGRRYEIFHTGESFEEAKKNALSSLQLVEPVLRKHRIKLAVENHKDWRATELAAMMKRLGSEWIGVTLDFGNSISLLEDPMEVIKTLAPVAFATHVKDMGVAEYEKGFLLSEVPLGEGIIDLSGAVAICRQHNPDITFNLEMITRDPLEVPCLTEDYWSTFAAIPGSDLARTLSMVKAHHFTPALPTVSQLTPEERLAVEEQNIVACMAYSKTALGLK